MERPRGGRSGSYVHCDIHPRRCVVGHVGPEELVVADYLDVALRQGGRHLRHSVGVKVGPSLPASRPAEVDHHF
eukprot:4043628-Pyramimonas_sp.AAC.1